MNKSTDTDKQIMDAPFVEKAYGEAMALVTRAATLLEGEGEALREALPPELRPVFTAESLRVTTRLMQVVAWLMIRRAVIEGEMSASEAAAPKHRLGAREICLADPLAGTEALPAAFMQIADESRSLYERIVWLEDSQLDGGQREGGADNPVHALLNRIDRV